MPQLYLLNTLSIPDPQYPTNPPALPINKVFYSSPYIFTMDLENGLFMYPMYRVRAYQFDPTAKTFTLKDDFYTRFTFPVFDAAFDGTYLHVGGVEWNGAGLRAYQFNGSIWVFKGMIDTGSAPRYGSQDQVVATITDGTYIYVAKTMSFLYSCAISMRKCYTFNGTTYTQVGVSNSLLLMIFADSGYLYCSSGNNVLAYDHTFSLLQTQAVGFSFSAGAGDGTYVYFGSSTSNIIKIYSFNGSAFTYIG